MATRQSVRPLVKVALLVGVTEYQTQGSLKSPQINLDRMKEQLESYDFLCHPVLSSSSDNPKGAELICSLKSACTKLLASQPANDTLVVCYCTGHGAVDNQGQACLVAYNGDLVPIVASLQPLMQRVRWTVLLVDACRTLSASGSCTATSKFEVNFSTDNMCLAGNACTFGSTAEDGVYTEHIRQGMFDKNKSVYQVLLEAEWATTQGGTQRAETTSSAGAWRDFRAFSFAKALRQGNLFIGEKLPHMVGRAPEKKKVEKALESERLCAIAGGPGEGKTLLADTVGLECYYQGCYPAGVYRVDMRECQTLGVKQHLAANLILKLQQAGCLDHADADSLQSIEQWRRDEGPTGQPTADNWQMVEAWLRQEKEASLVLLDNAEEALLAGGLTDAIERMFSCSKTVAVMLTARVQSLRVLSAVTVYNRPLPNVVLNGLPEQDAVELLYQELKLEQQPEEQQQEEQQQQQRQQPVMSKVQEEEMKRLARGCQNNPLVLLFVAALIKNNRCTLEEALSPLDGRHSALLTSRFPAPVLTPNWMQLQKTWWRDVLGGHLNPDEMTALSQLSVFPSAFCLEGARHVAPKLEIGKLLRDLQDLTVLKELPAAEGIPSAQYFVMHPLHREVACELLGTTKAELQDAQAGLRDYVLSLAPKLSALPLSTALPLIQAEARNIAAAAPFIRTLQKCSVSAYAALDRAIALFQSLLYFGQYSLAHPVIAATRAVVEEIYGLENPATATTISHLARCLDRQGKTAEAVPLYEQALAIQQKVLGPQSTFTVQCLANLAQCLDRCGQPVKAESLLWQALALQQEVLGPNHRDVGAIANNLALCLHQSHGRAAAAEPLYRQSLDIACKEQGPEHPDTASIRHNLALCLDSQHKVVEAEDCYRQSVTLRQQLLGPKHPSTVKSIACLAHFLDRHGHGSEAEDLLRESLAIQRDVLGPEHPDTIASCINLAYCLHNSHGKAAEAELLLQQSLDTWREALGPKHPYIACVINNIAECMRSQDRLPEAQVLLRQSLALQQEVLGPKHPSTALTLNNLAACVQQDQGKAAEAESFYRQSLAIQQEVLGPKHPDTATALVSLAGCLYSQCKAADAEVLLEQSLAIRQEVLGPKHPVTVDCISSLAVCLLKQGKVAEAEPLYRQLLALRQEVLGLQHPIIATCISQLAICLFKEGKLAEAEPLFRQSLAIRCEVLGPKHPATVESQKHLAVCWCYQGFEWCEKVLGSPVCKVTVGLGVLTVLTIALHRWTKRI